MVVASDHVFGPEVGEHQQITAGVLLKKRLIIAGDTVGKRPQWQQGQHQHHQPLASVGETEHA